MTPAPDASPSSTPTAALRQWQDDVRLGHLITRELGNEHRNGVLGRWMAQRVAELLRRAEVAEAPTAKEAAERECQDLIIQLWEARDSWPAGGPLAPLLPTLETLLAGEPDYRRWLSRPADNPSIGWITALLQLQRQELRYFCRAVRDHLPPPLLEEMRQLLAGHRPDLSEEEARMLYFVTEASRLPFHPPEADTAADATKMPEASQSAAPPQAADWLAEFLAFSTQERQRFLARLPSDSSAQALPG